MRRQTSMMFVTGMLALFAPVDATAQARKGETLLDAVTRCRTVSDTARRLACYDAAAGELASARSNNEVTVLSRDEVAQKRRSLFGLVLPDVNLFGRGAERMPAVEELDSTVARLAVAGRDVFTVTMADGTVWRTTERARINPAAGDKVHIRRGALGSYLASFAGGRSVRIERVR